MLASGNPDAATKPLQPFLQSNCFECHDADVQKGGLDLTALSWDPANRANYDKWILIHDRVRDGEMPPAKQDRPEPTALKDFTSRVSNALTQHSAKIQSATGRTILRRLNRTEHERTLQDLLGISIPLKDMLPEDPPMHGFDNVAEGLRLSTLHMEKYLEVADAALDEAINLTAKPEPKKNRYTYKDEKGVKENLALPDNPSPNPKDKYSRKRVVFRDLPDALVLFTAADYQLGLQQFRVQRTGNYRIRISAYAYQSAGTDVTLRLYTNNFREKRLLGFFDMPPDQPREIEFTGRIQKGEHLLFLPTGVGRDQDGKRLSDYETTTDFKGTGLAVQWIDVEGPLFDDETWPPKSLTDLFPNVPITPLDPKKHRTKDPGARAFEIAPTDPAASVVPVLERFATKAFRRPLDPGEIAPYADLVQTALTQGDKFEQAMRIGFRAILTSPSFLMFEERPGPLDDHALASRLSYFFWSSLPDDELLQLATAKKLRDPATLKAQTERLLNHPKSAAFVENFTGQWLDLRSIDATSPDARLYPEFEEMLKRAMVTESQEFFRELLTKNLPITNIIHSDFVMVNSRLAEHYNLPNVRGEQFRKVSLPPDSPRGGVITQAAVLKVTANGTTTSPVMRGTWVMKRLLGQPPQPPPANVGSIEPDTRGATTIRELLDKHRNVASCMGCHSKIDPPGFALENFDVIGGYRDRYRSQEKGDQPPGKFEGRSIWQYKLGPAVDSSGILPDGRTFTSIHDFKKLLLTQQEQITRALASKLLTYATGAGITFADRQPVEEILHRTTQQGSGLRTLIHEIVASPTFQTK
ncbi:DUF1592 domain-containing protein [Phragmitibacter flavus]|uniref:DUF1592 domain-containing protein n=1 Tax=Phragmitibacter flavus TaxID=2576071 RepID=A0A5R8K8N8_9BACT|nr:DUF1592 domain-containing protein [Phragmitibacter flavus]